MFEYHPVWSISYIGEYSFLILWNVVNQLHSLKLVSNLCIIEMDYEYKTLIIRSTYNDMLIMIKGDFL
jgi:hypothetical protein